MRRESADKIKSLYATKHHYESALILMSPQQLEDALKLLDAIQNAFERSISDFCLDLAHDLLDDQTPQIVRSFWFSKGINDYYLCIDGTGLIRALSDRMPNRLFDQISKALDPFYS